MIFLLFTIYSSLLYADVPPQPPANKQFVRHYIQLKDMEKHTDFSLLVFDKQSKGKTIKSIGSFTAKRSKDVLIANQATSMPPSFGKPEIWLMSKTDHQAWSVELSTTILKQRQDCMNGIGCAHISRFRPSFSAPTKVIPCNVDITPVLYSKKDGPTKIVDTFSIKELSASTCILQKQARRAWNKNKEVSTDSMTSGCTSTPINPGWLLTIMALVGTRRSFSSL